MDSIEKPLQVVHLFSSNCGYRWFLDQVIALRNEGVSVEVVLSGEGWLSSRLREENIPVHFFDLSLPWSIISRHALFDMMKTFAGLVDFLRAGNFDVAHFHLLESAIVGRLASWVAEIPTRIRMIETPLTLAAPGSIKLEQLTQWIDTKTVASSNRIRDQYIARCFPPDDLQVTYYGCSSVDFTLEKIDPVTSRAALNSKYNIPIHGPLIGMVAHFYAPFPATEFVPDYLWNMAVKQHQIFLETASLLKDKYPSARFLLAGGSFRKEDQAYLRKLESYALELGISDRVFFLGMIDEVPQLLTCLSVAVQCSLEDNLGGVLESLSLAVPTIATTRGAFDEIIVDGVSGLLVEPFALDLSAGIASLLSDQRLARTMAELGRSKVQEKFTVEKSAQEIASLYRTCSAVNGRAQSSKNIMKWLSHAQQSLRFTFILPLVSAILFVLWRQELIQKLSTRRSEFHIRRLLASGFKRAFDVLFSAALLLLFSPFILIVLPLLKLHPATYEMQMINVRGLNGQCLRLQSWWALSVGRDGTYSPRESQDLELLGNSFRNRLAREFWWIPALTNVLRGEISFVGPALRPVGCQVSVGQLWDRSRPGLTGWSQLQNCESSFDAELKDSLYVSSFGILLDLKILLKAMLESCFVCGKSKRSAKQRQALPEPKIRLRK